MALQDYQRADLPRAEHPGGARHIVDQPDRRLARQAVRREADEKHAPPAQLLQHAAKLRLEEDQEGERHDEADVAEQPLQGDEPEPAADDVRPKQHGQSRHELHGARAADQHQNLVDDQGDNEDVDEVTTPVRNGDADEVYKILDAVGDPRHRCHLGPADRRAVEQKLERRFI
jgi:hypothetical protein